MAETPSEDIEDPPADLEEIDESELDDVNDDVQPLIEDLRRETDASLRLAIRYTADDYEVLFARKDVAEAFSPPELETRVETLVMKGLGDPATDTALFDLGTLDATVRFYENALIAHFPYREWSGFVFVLDREAAPMVDLVDDHLTDD
jgi:hypothetical protein